MPKSKGRTTLTVDGDVGPLVASITAAFSDPTLYRSLTAGLEGAFNDAFAGAQRRMKDLEVKPAPASPPRPAPPSRVDVRTNGELREQIALAEQAAMAELRRGAAAEDVMEAYRRGVAPLQQQLDLLRDQGKAVDAYEKAIERARAKVQALADSSTKPGGSATARSLGLNTARGIQDLGMGIAIGGGDPLRTLSTVTMSVGNNVDMMLYDWKRLREEMQATGKAGQSVWKMLATGSTGAVLGMNAFIAGAVALPAIWDAIQGRAAKAAEEARKYREEQEKALRAAYANEATDSDLSTAGSLDALKAQRAEMEAYVAEYKRLVELRSTLADQSKSAAALSQGVSLPGTTQGELKTLLEVNAALATMQERYDRITKDGGLLAGVRTQIGSEEARLEAQVEAFTRTNADLEEQQRGHAARLARLRAEARHGDADAQRAAWQAERALEREEQAGRVAALEEHLGNLNRLADLKRTELRTATDDIAKAEAERALAEVAEKVRVTARLIGSLKLELFAFDQATRRGPVLTGGSRRDWEGELADVLLRTRRMRAEVEEDGVEERLGLLEVERDEKLAGLDKELRAAKDAGQHRAGIERAIAEQRIMVEQWYEDERSKIEREERQRRRDVAREAEDIELETSRMALEFVGDEQKQRLTMEMDHQGKLRDLRRQIVDEEDKPESERNQAKIDALQAQIAKEEELYGIRRQVLERHLAEMQAVRARERTLMLTASERDLQRARDLAARAAEDGVGGIFGFSSAGSRERMRAEGDLVWEQRQKMTEVEEEFTTRMEELRREREVGRELSQDELDRIAAEELLAEQMRQNRLAQIQAEGQQKRLEMEREFNMKRREFVMQTTEEVFGALSQAAKASADSYVNARREQLIEQGKSEREATRIAYDEGKKRFEVYKALAIAETLVSTYAAAQKAYESASAFGPIAAGVAASVAVASGLARVAAIRAQSFRGKGSASGSTLGAGASYGAVTGVPTLAPLSSGSFNAVGAALNRGGDLGAKVDALRADMQQYARAIEQRPAIVQTETQGRIVKGGVRYNETFTR